MENSIEWIGKIALMYPSDNYYTYANGVDSTCHDDPASCYEGNQTKGWIYNSNIRDNQTDKETMWLLSPYVVRSPWLVFFIYPGGDLYEGARTQISNDKYCVRPVLYLTPNIIITSGDGSIDTPYTIAKP